MPDRLWPPALDQDGTLCDGAEVAELTGMVDLDGARTPRPAAVHAAARIRAGHNGRTTTVPLLHSDGPFHLRRLRPAADGHESA